MLNKIKVLIAGAALAIGPTAFASAGEARTYYYWGWGWQAVPVGDASYVARPRELIEIKNDLGEICN
jgi:hypothetical protein